MLTHVFVGIFAITAAEGDVGGDVRVGNTDVDFVDITSARSLDGASANFAVAALKDVLLSSESMAIIRGGASSAASSGNIALASADGGAAGASGALSVSSGSSSSAAFTCSGVLAAPCPSHSA